MAEFKEQTQGPRPRPCAVFLMPEHRATKYDKDGNTVHGLVSGEVVDVPIVDENTVPHLNYLAQGKGFKFLEFKNLELLSEKNRVAVEKAARNYPRAEAAPVAESKAKK